MDVSGIFFHLLQLGVGARNRVTDIRDKPMVNKFSRHIDCIGKTHLVCSPMRFNSDTVQPQKHSAIIIARIDMSPHIPDRIAHKKIPDARQNRPAKAAP